MSNRNPSYAQRLLAARNVIDDQLELWRNDDLKAARDLVLTEIDRKLRSKGWTYVAPLGRWYRHQAIWKLRPLSA